MLVCMKKLRYKTDSMNNISLTGSVGLLTLAR